MSGAITGTPSSSGTFGFTAMVSDTSGRSATQALSITVNSSTGSAPTITTTSLPGGVVGQAYSATLQATGGTTPYTWSISVGALPTGLGLNGTTGAISGTPSAAAMFNFSVRVSGANNLSASQALSIVVSAAATGPTISTTSLSAGIVSQAYSAMLQATGGTLPYSWSISAGGLPTGLILDGATGVISGTPSVAATFNFTVQVTDAGRLSATQALSIVVTTSSGTAGCGALNGGVAPYDQTTCGNVGASFAPVGTSISSCQSLSSGTYTLMQDVSAGTGGNCFSVSPGVVLNLNGHTVTGTISDNLGSSGVHIYNGTVNCSADTCLDFNTSDTATAPITLEYLTVIDSSTASTAGRAISVDWSASSALGTQPAVILRHLTTQAPPSPTSSRTSNLWVVVSLISDINNNFLTCPPNASACQGVTLWNNTASNVYNNRINMADTTSLAQDGRALICDGSSASCNFYNNYINAVNNRAFRYRAYNTTQLPGPFNWHDNLIDNVANTTEGMLHFCDPDYGTLQFNTANNVAVYNNTFVFGPNALGVFTRDCAPTGPVVRNNAVKCAASGCSGSTLARVTVPLGTGGSTSNLTLKNNALDSGIGGITVDSGGTANYCNTGVCSGAGCVALTVCTTP